MSFLQKIFGKGKTVKAASAPTAACPHTVLLPRWDSLADMGNEDKVTRFMCEACHATFTAEEGLALRSHEADRLKQELVGQEAAQNEPRQS